MSDKNGATSTLGGAVPGAVVGTAVGTPVVGTFIGASGAVIGARQHGACKSQPTMQRAKAKTSPTKKRAPRLGAAKKSQVGAKAKDGDEVFKGFNAKDHEARHRKQPALHQGERARSQVLRRRS